MIDYKGKDVINYNLIVTGDNDKDKSEVVSSEPIPVNNYFIYQPGFSAEVFWRTAKDSSVGGIFKPVLWGSSSILPEVGGTTAMIVTFPPATDIEPSEPVDIENLIKEVNERLPGLAETFESDPPGFHFTNTVDYVVLLEGELKLFLDNDEVDLKVGDVVVQNGTRHAWVNQSKEPARFLVIMSGKERK
jgi:mannose-6-phosphate isomerase-like protein (cupin superfamily)